jgi:hypothetical protein
MAWCCRSRTVRRTKAPPRSKSRPPSTTPEPRRGAIMGRSVRKQPRPSAWPRFEARGRRR